MNTTTKLVLIAIGIFLIVIVGSLLLPFGIIGAGERGVVFNNFSGLEKGRILPEGTYWRTPFAENVISMPVRTQKTDFQEQAGTNDSQIINVNITVNWHLDAGKVDQIYDQLGGSLDTIESTVFTNNVQDAVKAGVSKYQALEIQRNRDNVTAIARQTLQSKVAKYHIIIDGLSFTNISFSQQFTDAIEAAATATQKAVEATNNEKVAQANLTITETNADAQSYQQKVLQQTLTPELLTKMAIEKWDGKFPQYMLGGNTLPFLNIPTAGSTGQ